MQAWLWVMFSGFTLVFAAIAVTSFPTEPVWQSALAMMIYVIGMGVLAAFYRILGWAIRKTKADIEAFQDR